MEVGQLEFGEEAAALLFGQALRGVACPLGDAAADGGGVELYDIPKDPTQLSNITEHHANVVARLSQRVLAWHKTLPDGPTDPGAGKVNYPYPGKAAPAAKAKGKGKAKQ